MPGRGAPEAITNKFHTESQGDIPGWEEDRVKRWAELGRRRAGKRAVQVWERAGMAIEASVGSRSLP